MKSPESCQMPMKSEKKTIILLSGCYGSENDVIIGEIRVFID
jgi:hypothetical protein